MRIINQPPWSIKATEFTRISGHCGRVLYYEIYMIQVHGTYLNNTYLISNDDKHITLILCLSLECIWVIHTYKYKHIN